jgi:GNAT superfamily N-acetyltransferase
VAETSDKVIVGYATFIFCYYTWVGKSLYMDDLYVLPAYRGKGIGTLLIGKVIDYARETKCHRLRWQVSKWNDRAIVFYKSLGAVINETEQNCDISF